MASALSLELRVYRLRLKFAKKGPLRFLSHLELIGTFEKAARRATLPLKITEGFNPHPKISWGPSLPVGFESESEYLDLFLKDYLSPSEAKRRLQSFLPKGLTVLRAKYIPLKLPSLSSEIKVARFDKERKIRRGLYAKRGNKLVDPTDL